MGQSWVEVEFPGDSSQQGLVDLFLPPGGAVEPQLLRHPQQQSLQVLATAELHEDPTQTLYEPGALQVIPEEMSISTLILCKN